jgi:hypothetical protein
VAEYETDAYTNNQVTIWDTIIQSASEAKLKLRGLQRKYSLTDIRRQLAK